MKITSFLSFALAFCCFTASPSFAAEGETSETKSLPKQVSLSNKGQPEKEDFTLKNLKGWGYLYNKLLAQGLEAELLKKIFTDRSMPHNKPLFFSLNPKEPKSIYRKVHNKKALQNAFSFYGQHEEHFQKASTQFQVSHSIILSILQIETHCGKNTGKSSALQGLLRLASAGSPENIKRNYEAQKAKNKRVRYEEVETRAKWLENMFLPHASAAISLADNMNLHPLHLKGSPSGAIGLPQFLPGNVLRFGVDGDEDGEIDIFSAPDAIHSVANYFKLHGWDNTLSTQEKRTIIRKYNNSDPYIDTVLSMADALDKMIIVKKDDNHSSRTQKRLQDI